MGALRTETAGDNNKESTLFFFQEISRDRTTHQLTNREIEIHQAPNSQLNFWYQTREQRVGSASCLPAPAATNTIFQLLFPDADHLSRLFISSTRLSPRYLHFFATTGAPDVMYDMNRDRTGLSYVVYLSGGNKPRSDT